MPASPPASPEFNGDPERRAGVGKRHQVLLGDHTNIDDEVQKIEEFAWIQRKLLGDALSLEDVPCATVEAIEQGDILSGFETVLKHVEAQHELVKQMLNRKELLVNDNRQLLRITMIVSLVKLESLLLFFHLVAQVDLSEEQILAFQKEGYSEKAILLKIGQHYGELLAYNNLLSDDGARLVESHMRSKARTKGTRASYDVTDNDITAMIREAKRLHQEGMKQNAIAVEFNKNPDKYGLSQQSARSWNKYLLIHRQEWKI